MTESRMITELNPNPAHEPATLPSEPTEASTGSGPSKKDDHKRLNQVANHLAHNGAKAEQAFDSDNERLFNK